MTNRRSVLISFIAGGIGILVIIGITAGIVAAVTATNIRGTQQNNTQTLDTSAETLRIIKECTTPGEECYDRGQAQTAKAIGDINRVAIIAAACASGPDEISVADITTCVIQRLAAESRKP